MTGRWPNVTFNLCPKNRSIKIDLSLNPIRHAPDSNQNKNKSEAIDKYALIKTAKDQLEFILIPELD